MNINLILVNFIIYFGFIIFNYLFVNYKNEYDKQLYSFLVMTQILYLLLLAKLYEINKDYPELICIFGWTGIVSMYYFIYFIINSS